MKQYEICPNCGGSKESNFGELSGKPLIGTCPTCKGEGRRLTRKYLEAILRKVEADNAALRQENDIQRQGIQNLSTQVVTLRQVKEAAQEVVDSYDCNSCRCVPPTCSDCVCMILKQALAEAEKEE